MNYIVYTFKEKFFVDNFKKRLNRFVVETESGRKCHLHDPGRLEELLVPGRPLFFVKKSQGLKCEIYYTKVDNEFVIINSKIHSDLARNIINTPLFKNFTVLKSEVKLNKSRIDFLLEHGNKEFYMEVKGCTLTKNGIALFPDAPTERGKRHVEELENLLNMGFESGVMFLVFRKSEYFSPNWDTDPKFSKRLKSAYEKGLKIFPVQLYFDGKNVYAQYFLKTKMEK